MWVRVYVCIYLRMKKGQGTGSRSRAVQTQGVGGNPAWVATKGEGSTILKSCVEPVQNKATTKWTNPKKRLTNSPLRRHHTLVFSGCRRLVRAHSSSRKNVLCCLKGSRNGARKSTSLPTPQFVAPGNTVSLRTSAVPAAEHTMTPVPFLGSQLHESIVHSTN